MRQLWYVTTVIVALLLAGCADAGRDQKVKSGAPVTLDGNASTASLDGELKSYQWRQVRGKRVVLSDKKSVQATFVAPIVTKETRLLFGLVTTEVDGYISPFKTRDYIQIIVEPAEEENQPPQAVATVSSSSITTGETVTFDASGSSDSDGEIVSYIWRDESGTVLSEAQTFTYTFTDIGVHTFTLTVTDDDAQTGSTSVAIEVKAAAEVVYNICNQSNDLGLPDNHTEKPCSVSTFHSISIYWNANNEGNVSLEYKIKGGTWKKAKAMIYNPIESLISYITPKQNSAPENIISNVKKGDTVSKGNYRGSIVNLEQNQTYLIRVNEDNSTRITVSTLNESFKIKETHTVFNGCQDSYQAEDTCTVQYSGSKEEGYVVLDGTREDGTKRTLNANGDYNIDISNKSYIIVRNFKLKGASKHAVYIQNSHHIVIENCEISEWGSKDINYARDGDSAIYSDTNLYASIFQRNTFFNPNYAANSWAQLKDRGTDNHPKGAQGITLKYCKTGNNIIRYNTFYATKGHYFNDPMGGGKNWSHYGFPGADSDIYGNYIANAYDDGIEADGGGQNVRIWNNYIEKTYTAISDTPTTVGPLYIWKNITGPAELVGVGYPYSCVDTKVYRGAFLKMGGANVYLNDQYIKIKRDAWRDNGADPKLHLVAELMQGKIYLYNNTVLDLNGSGYGGIGTAQKCNNGKFSNRPMRHIASSNNILYTSTDIHAISIDAKQSQPSTEQHINNMMRIALDGGQISETIIVDNPHFEVNMPALDDNKSGNFKLNMNSEGKEKGKCIDNIIPIKHPDVGAQQHSEMKMKFGINYKFEPPTIQSCNIGG